MKGARTFSFFMLALIIFALGVLIESSINDNTAKANLALTRMNDDLLWNNATLTRQLRDCEQSTYELKSVELTAPVTNGFLRAVDAQIRQFKWNSDLRDYIEVQDE